MGVWVPDLHSAARKFFDFFIYFLISYSGPLYFCAYMLLILKSLFDWLFNNGRVNFHSSSFLLPKIWDSMKFCRK